MTNPLPQMRIKYLFNVVNGSTPQSSAEEYWDGDIPWVTPEDIGKLRSSDIHSTRRYITEDGYRSCGTTLAPKDSIVLTTRAPIGNIGIAKVALCSNQGCKILIPNNRLVPKFGFYALFAQVPLLQSLGQGSTFRELSSDSLRQTSLPTLPLPTQKAIVSFLDKETSRMDALISKKERQIELLQEKRHAIITKAVTKGLDPNVKMKESGVEWIGHIPEAWEVRRLKYITPEITVGIVVNPSSYYENEGILCLRSLNISDGQLDLTNPVYISTD